MLLILGERLRDQIRVRLCGQPTELQLDVRHEAQLEDAVRPRCQRRSPAREARSAEAIDHEDGPRGVGLSAGADRLDALQCVAERFGGSIENDDERFGAEEAQRGDETFFTQRGSRGVVPQVDVDALDRRRRRRVGGGLARLGADRGVRQGQAEQRRQRVELGEVGRDGVGALLERRLSGRLAFCKMGAEADALAVSHAGTSRAMMHSARTCTRRPSRGHGASVAAVQMLREWATLAGAG